jgi:hypothetical protein
VLRLERNHGASGVEPFVDLRSVEFSFLERLEEINLGEVPARLAGLIESKARAAGVIVSDDYKAADGRVSSSRPSDRRFRSPIGSGRIEIFYAKS